MTPEQKQRRIERIQSEEFPRFGHEGMHHGRPGDPDCPEWLHHHHGEFCAQPSIYEWREAGRTGPINTRSRAGARHYPYDRQSR
jgi:hypothetical protein